jgi:hypothetical protein
LKNIYFDIIKEIVLTLIDNIFDKSTIGTENISTNSAMMFSVKESEVFSALGALVNLLIRDPCSFFESCILDDLS